MDRLRNRVRTLVGRTATADVVVPGAGRDATDRQDPKARAVAELKARLTDIAPPYDVQAANMNMLHRFLASRNYKVDKAERLFRDWVVEAQDKCFAEITEADIAPLKRMGYLEVLGKDLEGHPVMYYNTCLEQSLHIGGEHPDPAMHVKYIVKMCGDVIADLDDTGHAFDFGIVWLIDTTGAAVKFPSKHIKLNGKFEQVFRGCTKCVMVMPVNKLVKFVVKLLKPFIKRKVYRKIFLIAAGQEHELLMTLPAEIVPEHLGGTYDLGPRSPHVVAPAAALLDADGEEAEAGRAGALAAAAEDALREREAEFAAAVEDDDEAEEGPVGPVTP